MYSAIKKSIRFLLPHRLYEWLLPFYHLTLVYSAVLWYWFPSRRIKVVGITGTKGKSSVSEYVNSILESAGYTTALASTIRFKIADSSHPNKLKMTMPGRFFLQRFLRKAVKARCDWVIIEITSEGTKQFRHRGISLDTLIFTNIAPEHIESHGSFENYVAAKMKIGDTLATSSKRQRTIIANKDDTYGERFLSLAVDTSIPYSLSDIPSWSTNHDGTTITYHGTSIHSPFPGTFTAYNMLAAATFATSINISLQIIKEGLEKTTEILGRVQSIRLGQSFDVIIDYAHTVESLEQLYKAFQERTKICVLGNTGGGRDSWKRPNMARMAEKYCEHIILTDEDPYDENPQEIIDAMAEGMTTKPTIIRNRRVAIHEALTLAHKGDGNTVLITGKGTDPFIMRAHGKREEWSDAVVAREELKIVLKQ